MPRQISRQHNMSSASTVGLGMLITHMGSPSTPNAEQVLFDMAMTLHRRPNKTTNHEILVRKTLRKLAHNYGLTWTINPSSNRFIGNNYNSNANLNSNADSNNINHNYVRASGAVKKWLAARPHTVHQNVVHIKLPANASDPVSFNNFKPGNEAVMVIKKRLQANGTMRSKRTFYTKKSIGGMAATHRMIAAPHANPVPWRTILRMKGSDIVFKDPINRRAVYRRDLMNVKFV